MIFASIDIATIWKGICPQIPVITLCLWLLSIVTLGFCYIKFKASCISHRQFFLCIFTSLIGLNLVDWGSKKVQPHLSQGYELTENVFLSISIALALLLLIAILKEPILKTYFRYRNTPYFISYDYVISPVIMTSVLAIPLIQLTNPEFEISPSVSLWILYANLITVAPFLYMEIRYQREKPKSKEKENSTFGEPKSVVIDKPINEQNEDLLQRDKFVYEFSETLQKYTDSETHVFGLLGDWGEGKTSVINLIIKRFEETGSSPIIIRFDPWYFNSQEKILESFFDSIFEAFNQESMHPKLLGRLKKYRSLLSSGIKQASFNFDIFSGIDDSLFAQKKEIDELLKIVQKKVIVFIDDVDRLDSDEMKFVFKLTRLCSDFSHFIYVLAYDKKVVQTVLNSGFNVERFLEKIVQTEVPLPKIHQSTLDGLFNPLFDDLFARLDIQPDDKAMKRIGDVYHKHIKYCFTNFREIKRFFNSLFISLVRIKGEVDIVDFLLLEIIRDRYPDTYRYIYHNAELFHNAGGVRHISLRYIQVSSEQRQQALQTALTENNLTEQSRDTLKRLIVELFPAMRENEFAQGSRPRSGEQAISNPDYFSKYFSFMVDPKDISDVYANQLISSIGEWDQETCDNEIKQLIQDSKESNKLHMLFVKLEERISLLDAASKKRFFQSLYCISDTLSVVSSSDYFSEETEVAMFLFNLIADLGENEGLLLLSEAISNSPSDRFASHLRYLALPDQTSLSYQIDQNKLQDVYDERLKRKYVDGGMDVFVECPEDFVPVIRQWSEVPRHQYVENILRNSPCHVHSLLAQFVETWQGTTAPELKYSDLISVIPPNLISEALEQCSEPAINNKIDSAIEQFRNKFIGSTQ